MVLSRHAGGFCDENFNAWQVRLAADDGYRPCGGRCTGSHQGYRSTARAIGEILGADRFCPEQGGAGTFEQGAAGRLPAHARAGGLYGGRDRVVGRGRLCTGGMSGVGEKRVPASSVVRYASAVGKAQRRDPVGHGVRDAGGFDSMAKRAGSSQEEIIRE